MSDKYTRDQKMMRMAQLMESSDEVILDYRDYTIQELYERLELESDYGTIRFIQGQIAGIRDFCLVVKE
jgi:hypothetical protein